MKIINLIFLLLIMAFSNISLAIEKLQTNDGSTTTHYIQKKPKLLFLAGSARKDSVNKMLAHNAFEIAKAIGADVYFVDLKDYPLPIYDADLESKQGLPAKAIALKKIFADHDGIFIASPEYNSSISPLLKNTLDWVSRSNEKNEPANIAYRNKIIALASASPGSLGGMRGLVPLQMMLSNMGVIVLPKKINISKAYDKFNNKGSLTNTEDYQELTEVVMDFIRITTAIKNSHE